MADFGEFVRHWRRIAGPEHPLVLVDLKGRGRSSYRRRSNDYSSLNDARDLSALADALGLERAAFLGQGYGGQVIMALASLRPKLLAAAILIDSGPLTDPRGLVRLRNNLEHIGSLKGETVIRTAFRQVLAADYPGASDAVLDRLAQRTHLLDKRGAHGLFDPYFLKRLHEFEHDDVLVPQWPLFEALTPVPLMLLRTQLTDQLRRQTFDEMLVRRSDATALVIAGQGSPALLDHADEVGAIAAFLADFGAASAPTTETAAT